MRLRGIDVSASEPNQSGNPMDLCSPTRRVARCDIADIAPRIRGVSDVGVVGQTALAVDAVAADEVGAFHFRKLNTDFGLEVGAVIQGCIFHVSDVMRCSEMYVPCLNSNSTQLGEVPLLGVRFHCRALRQKCRPF